MADNDDLVVEEQEASGPSLGTKLRDARESRDLSIEEIATELRIEPHLLRALEECRFDALGAPVFAKGYLKQYGTRLGLDYRDLLGDYYDIVGRTEIDISPSRVIKLRDERQIMVWIIAALAIGLLAVFLFLWWLDEPIGLPGFTSTARPSPTLDAAAESADGALRVSPGASPDLRATTTEIASPRSTESDAGPTAFDGTVAAAPAPVDGVAARAADRGSTTAPTAPAESRSDPGDAPVAGVASPGPADTEAAGGAAAESAVAIDPRALRVELEFTEECWADITDAAGVRHFYGIGAPGRRESFAALPPIRFSLGNAGGIRITINDRPYPVPGRARSGDVARFSVDAIAD